MIRRILNTVKAVPCGFGDIHNDMLRDHLVCIINDGGNQRRLLSEPDLTYNKSLYLAQAMEAPERNVQDHRVQ